MIKRKERPMNPRDQNDRPEFLPPSAKQPWEPMQVTPLGHIGDVLQGGGGKLPINSQDSGDTRKPPGGG